MAASSAFADPALTPQKLIPMTQSPIPPVIRTEVHTMHTGRGLRSVRRRISPSAGFALEILGHAIEYMADEYAHDPGSLPCAKQPGDPRIEAMQVLMAANRQVYYACPVVTSLWERLPAACWCCRCSRGWYSRGMEIVLNGQTRSIGVESQNATLDALIAALQMKADRIAVERNGEIVPRAEWQSTRVHEGDRLEIVHFVGGGW